MALGSTQPLTEMSTRNLPGGKGRPARKADNLAAICEPTVWTKCGSLHVSEPYGSSRPVTGIALPLPYQQRRYKKKNSQSTRRHKPGDGALRVQRRGTRMFCCRTVSEWPEMCDVTHRVRVETTK
jgi:hypothetical protein